MKDYYYILGISRDASIEEIKKSYRKLSLKFHPDKNDGDKFFEDRFKDINEAYETLVDPNKKRIFDENLSTSFFNSNRSNTYSYTKEESTNEDSIPKRETHHPTKDDTKPIKKRTENGVLDTMFIILFAVLGIMFLALNDLYLEILNKPYNYIFCFSLVFIGSILEKLWRENKNDKTKK